MYFLSITPDEIVDKSGADYIKTSTGFSTSGATFEDIKLFKESLKGSSLKIKAAGGVKSFEDAEKFIELGADDDQLDFDVIYASAINGTCSLSDDLSTQTEGFNEILDKIIEEHKELDIDDVNISCITCFLLPANMKLTFGRN